MDTLNKIFIVNLVLVLSIQIVMSFSINKIDIGKNNNNSSSNSDNNKSDDSLSIENNLSWACANNATCISNLAKTVTDNLVHNRAINFGFMQIESLNPKQIKYADGQARGMSSNFLQFLRGHSIKIPFGPMVVSIQGSEDHDNYFEVSLLKKAGFEGRRRRDKKQLQMYIPAFLAVNAIGWMLLAIATVKALTFKALLVSKAAFIIASVMTVKKMMDHVSEKPVIAMPHVMESHQHEYMMPYSMEYSGSHPFHGSEMGGVSEMAMAMHNAGSSIDMASLHGMGSLGAESHINSVVDMHNATQLAALQSSLAQSKTKRNDVVWNGGTQRQSNNNNNNYNYVMSKNPFVPYQKS